MVNKQTAQWHTVAYPGGSGTPSRTEMSRDVVTSLPGDHQVLAAHSNIAPVTAVSAQKAHSNHPLSKMFIVPPNSILVP